MVGEWPCHLQTLGNEGWSGTRAGSCCRYSEHVCQWWDAGLSMSQVVREASLALGKEGSSVIWGWVQATMGRVWGLS